MPPRDQDFRVTGVEITQGIQIFDIPTNTSSSTRYYGVRLVRGRRTIVRVFANRTGGQSPPDVQARLYGVGESVVPSERRQFLWVLFLHPTGRGRSLSRGALEVTSAERRNPDGGYVFELPLSWTNVSRLTLRAVVDPDNVYGPGSKATLNPECPTCLANNTFEVTDIPLEESSRLSISPIEVIWTDAKGFTHRPSSNTPQIFAAFANVSPLAEGLPQRDSLRWHDRCHRPRELRFDGFGLEFCYPRSNCGIRNS